jgi:hypothetical protein
MPDTGRPKNPIVATTDGRKLPSMVKPLQGEAWRWTRVKEQAARLMASGELTDRDIAKRVGVGWSSIARWKNHAEFLARVESHVEAQKLTLISHGIASKAGRVDEYNHRWTLMQQIREERSDLIRADLDRAEADPTYTSEWAGVAGATTGFIVKVVKTIGSGQNQQVITEFKLDKDLLEAFLAHEKQAAQELGQWIEKRDLTGQVDHTVTVDQLRRAIMLPASPTVEADFSEVAPE